MSSFSIKNLNINKKYQSLMESKKSSKKCLQKVQKAIITDTLIIGLILNFNRLYSVSLFTLKIFKHAKF